jgi:hypothetical protein
LFVGLQPTYAEFSLRREPGSGRAGGDDVIPEKVGVVKR